MARKDILDVFEHYNKDRAFERTIRAIKFGHYYTAAQLAKLDQRALRTDDFTVNHVAREQISRAIHELSALPDDHKQ